MYKSMSNSTSHNTTNRPTVQSIDNILQKHFALLDNGFVRVIDYMGNDDAIVQAARVSYGKGTKTVNDDKALIRYLLKNKHTTPFEMCEIKLHIKAPIFVARQWIRHRTANVNEYSARYSEMKPEYYVPSQENIQVQSKYNKQGREGNFTEDTSKNIVDTIKKNSQETFNIYSQLLEPKEENKTLAKEIARVVLPVNFYTEFYWKIDLHNLLHFLNLRTHTHAQYEIRVYAKQILDIVKLWVPITHEAFLDYIIDSVTLNNKQITVIKDIINNKIDIHNIDNTEYGLSKAELRTVINKLT